MGMHSVGSCDLDSSGDIVAVLNEVAVDFVVGSSVVALVTNFCVCGIFSLACVLSTVKTISTPYTTLFVTKFTNESTQMNIDIFGVLTV